MAHPKREAFVASLVDQLDVENPLVIWDTSNNRWDTGVRSLLAYRKWPTPISHWLCIQDDAIPCKDLVAGLEQIVTHTQNHPVALYMGRTRPNQFLTTARIRAMQTSGYSYVRMPGPWWGVGICLPVSVIPDLVEWGNTNPVTPNYDLRITRYFQSIGNKDCFYTLPSLVEHRHGPENPSLVAGRTSLKRRAWEFIGEDVSALSIDWSLIPPATSGIFETTTNHGRKAWVCTDCGYRMITQSQVERHNEVRHNVTTKRVTG